MMWPQIRHTHPAGFRSGEWAWLGAVELLERPGGDLRPCFRVIFEDGTVDHWAVYDQSEPYEFRNIEWLQSSRL